MAKQQLLPNLKTGGTARKLLGLAVLAVLIAFVVTSPRESASVVLHIVRSLKTFCRSL
jgi:hypothetical protein